MEVIISPVWLTEFYAMHWIISNSLAVSLLLAAFLPSRSQDAVFGPGPVGMDTISFARVYVIRDAGGPFPDYWFGVGQTPDAGLSARVSAGQIYCIHTLRSGRNFWWTSAGDAFVLELNTQRGDELFIEMVVKKTDSGNPKPELVQCSNEEGRRRLDEFSGVIQHRYCELPWDADGQFAWDLFRDTVRWYVDDDHYYRFSRLPAWEIFLKSPLRATVGFRNQLVSPTFSEVGGIDPLPRKKMDSAEDFRVFLDTDMRGLLHASWGVQKDQVVNWEMLGDQVVPWAQFSAMMFSEAIDEHVVQGAGTGPLTIRTAMVVFFWKHPNDKKGHTAMLYSSERGRPEELHTREQLLMRISVLLDDFEVRHMKRSGNKAFDAK